VVPALLACLVRIVQSWALLGNEVMATPVEGWSLKDGRPPTISLADALSWRLFPHLPTLQHLANLTLHSTHLPFHSLFCLPQHVGATWFCAVVLRHLT